MLGMAIDIHIGVFESKKTESHAVPGHRADATPFYIASSSIDTLHPGRWPASLDPEEIANPYFDRIVFNATIVKYMTVG